MKLVNKNLIQESDDEISIAELSDFIKAGWLWLLLGFTLGLFASVFFICTLNAKYDAVAIIGLSTPRIVPFPNQIVLPLDEQKKTETRLEAVNFHDALTRLASPKFYDSLLDVCRADSIFDIANNVKATPFSGMSIIRVRYRSNTTEDAVDCLDSIVKKLDREQSLLHYNWVKSNVIIIKQMLPHGLVTQLQSSVSNENYIYPPIAVASIEPQRVAKIFVKLLSPNQPLLLAVSAFAGLLIGAFLYVFKCFLFTFKK